MPCPCYQPIPGPDPGACPECGFWRAAGMVHNCEESRRAFEATLNVWFPDDSAGEWVGGA